MSELWFDDIKKGRLDDYSSKESSIISEVSSTHNKTK